MCFLWTAEHSKFSPLPISQAPSYSLQLKRLILPETADFVLHIVHHSNTKDSPFPITAISLMKDNLIKIES